MLLALSDEAEEVAIKEAAAHQDVRVTIIFISGMINKLQTSYTKAIINAAISGKVIKKKPNHAHAVLHASLEAFRALSSGTSAVSSIKIKVGIVADDNWVAVAIYGDSAFSAFTNHERSSLGIMHL